MNRWRDSGEHKVRRELTIIMGGRGVLYVQLRDHDGKSLTYRARVEWSGVVVGQQNINKGASERETHSLVGCFINSWFSCLDASLLFHL